MCVARPEITILLCTKDGATHLEAQLNSYIALTGITWRLWVSDDQSSDETLEVLRRFKRDHPTRDVRILQGPGRGHAANFLSLLCHPELPKGWVALSDQDDVWMPHRLERAIAKIKHATRPAHYASRTLQTDATLNPVTESRQFPAVPRFGNTLVQNYMSGNTTVLNPAALELIRLADVQDVPFHDWWITLLMSGVGAEQFYDHEPGLYYRQHGANALGSNSGMRGFFRRAALVFSTEYRDWINRNLAALRRVETHLKPENRALVQILAKRAAPSRRQLLCRLRRHGLHRLDKTHNIALYAALFLRRI